jgi:4-hydroxybenzoate polyprenyltransferase
MMAATLVLTRYCLLLPVYSLYDIPLQMPVLHFILLVLATLLTGAGGYIVNDLLDTGLDEWNKPGRNLVGKEISEENAWKLYYALNIAGVGTGALVSYMAGKPELGILFLLIATALYYYSLKYKYLPFWGNLTVSLLTALTVAIVWLFEFFYLKQSPADFVEISKNFSLINQHVFGFALLAFLFSMIREIIKDAQDEAGDARFGCRTIPILIGETGTKWLVAGMFLLSLVILAILVIYLMRRYMFLSVSLGVVSIMTIYALFRLLAGNGKPDYSELSRLSKAMLAWGMVSMIFLWLPN